MPLDGHPLRAQILGRLVSTSQLPQYGHIGDAWAIGEQTKRTKNPGRLPVILSTAIRSSGFVVDAATINVAG
jgi:hypothetical protein